MNTRNFGFALIAGLAFSALTMASVNAETIEVVGSANGCSSSFAEIFTTDDSAVSTVTISCPRLPVQVASTRQS